MTVIMITRLQLNLRSAQNKQMSPYDSEQSASAASAPSLRFAFERHAGPVTELSMESTFFTIGNLGEEVEDPISEDIRRKGTGSRNAGRRDMAMELRILPASASIV